MPSSKICIIGAGAAGLVTAKHAIKDGHEVELFEQTDSVGGTWVYSEKTGCHSSMYKIMKTNLPKEAMLFQDEPFREDLPSFMSHEDVLEYLVDYSKNFPIQFNTTVTDVRRDGEKWKVTTSTNSNQPASHFYDAVFVCNGHFFEPLNPYENSEFEGEMIHSHDYRRAEHFEGKTVVIVGAGPSGIDITLQVALTAFEFPFLDSSLIQLKHNDLMVSPLYQHLCHVDYPDSLFFIGLPLGTITFPLFEVQAKYALSLISGTGKLPPDTSKIQNFEARRLQGLQNPGAFHILVEEQWDYMKELAEMGGFEKWSYMETIRKLYCYIMSERKKNVIGYKMVNFEMNEDETDFRVVGI
ncbi:hypothetical protein CRE_07840 [Caenorhabditis remanei]|uniref:Flavin-containing monooxygenase n=1 Tax=Caenorhabditis remanei TaxID=31234 RepID=E3NGY5_CAERE|nr:hypothetical protein CRE_07840 [Caenorhabditis remanei]